MHKERIYAIRVLLIIIFIVLGSPKLCSQTQVSGTIHTNHEQDLQFTEVVLSNSDSLDVAQSLVDELGNFTLNSAQNGEFIFKVRQFGTIVHQQNLSLPKDMNLGTVSIITKESLQEVVVSKKKKLIERKIDRIVFNIENTIAATGGDALDALKITPGVKVQNDVISIIGKSTVSIMIDDKLIQLKTEDLSSFLQSISADNIKSIEVITTPPAKYDALGNSGMINIKTKTAKINSWNVNVGASYLQRSRDEESVFGNFNYNKNKLTLSTSLSYRTGSRYSTQHDKAFFSDALWHTASPYIVEYKRFSGKIALDYKLTENWSTGLQYTLNTNKPYFFGDVKTPVTEYETNNLIRNLFTNKETRNKPIFNSINYYNDFKLDTLGRKILVSIDYFNFENNDQKFYEGNSEVFNPYSIQYFAGKNNNLQNINNFSAKIDVEYPLTWLNLSFGAKAATSKAKNTISYYNSGLVNQPVTEFPFAENVFEYTENVQALYVSGQKKINDKWETQVGLRIENTQTEGNSLTLNTSTKNDYIKLFPTIYITYKPNDKNTFGINYSKRIERPTFNDLNPNLYFENAFQSIEGNPFLQPAFMDNVEFFHTYKNFDSKLYFSNEENLFGQVAIANPNTNYIQFTNKNYVNTKRIGFSETYTYNSLSWWNAMALFDVNYMESRSFIPELAEKQIGWSGRISTNNDFYLNQAKTWIFNLNYYYNFSGIDGKFYEIGDMSNLSATLQYVLLDKNLRITLKANDILRTEKIRVNSIVNNVYQKGEYYNDNQSVQLSISYKFGNQKIKAVRRETGNEEERSRTGN